MEIKNNTIVCLIYFLSIKNIKKETIKIDLIKFDLSPVIKIVIIKRKSKIKPFSLYLL